MFILAEYASEEEAAEVEQALAEEGNDMEITKKTVPRMSNNEAWIETMELYCITPYPPEIP